ncbi:MAG: peptidylprolyl isomerase [Nakamurella sp.]
MSTNQQRRDAAKRKLERQLVRRQELQKSRRQRTIIAGVIVSVVVIAGVIFLVTKKPAAQDAAASATEPAAACTYADAETAVKAVSKPDNTNPLTTGTVDATITLSQGALPVTLDRSLAPCAVNAFVSLAAQKFYDGTACHRLTTAGNFKILQCGDPSGTGRGGPGFSYAGESSPPVATGAAAANAYPVGTLAMANSAAGAENGSQFFIVYGESDLGSSGYTKIGTVGTDGLAIIDQIAAGGTKAGPNGAQDAPNATVTITSVAVPDDALTPTQVPTTTDAFPTDTLPTDAQPTDTLPTDSGTTDSGGTQPPADTTAADVTTGAAPTT